VTGAALRKKCLAFFHNERAQRPARRRQLAVRAVHHEPLPHVRAAGGAIITADDLMTIESPDLLASRVFGQLAAASSRRSDEAAETFD